jgi:hypothetical protein
MGGFLSRLRFGSDAEKTAAKQDAEPQLLGHEAAHVYQQDGTAPDPDAGLLNKVEAPDLNSEGNDVGMETLELSHEGLQVDEGSDPDPDATGALITEVSFGKLAAADGGGAESEAVIESVSPKYTMFNPDGTPTRADAELGLSNGSMEDQGMAIEKIELAHEKGEWISNLPSSDTDADDLAQHGDTASPHFSEALITNFEVPTLDAAMEDDDEELSSTLEPIAEAEKTGSLSFLAPDMKEELGNLDDDNPGVDDLL